MPITSRSLRPTPGPGHLAASIGRSSGAASAADPAARRRPLSALHHLYFAMVAAFALWVGAWGSLLPARVAMALPWPVPPLHARVIGAMYLSGLVLMLLCWRRRWVDEVAVGLRMATVWTGMLLLASLQHLGQFDPANPRVWFWFFAYVTFPLGGAWLAWRDRSWWDRSSLPVAAVAVQSPLWARHILRVLGLSFCALAALLFLAPQTMQAAWPWKTSVLLIQIYAGPCLSLGVGSLLLARPRHAAEIAAGATGMLSWVLLVLLASCLHRA
ncbi:MAG TPA: hypothetical protein VLK85_33945, partial [Ramlibacter sp.]|nr:hypothetical protein [Ramlibacter sp.]